MQIWQIANRLKFVCVNSLSYFKACFPAARRRRVVRVYYHTYVPPHVFVGRTDQA